MGGCVVVTVVIEVWLFLQPLFWGFKNRSVAHVPLLLLPQMLQDRQGFFLSLCVAWLLFSLQELSFDLEFCS